MKGDIVNALERLKELHDRGVLTDAEFVAQKKAVLSDAADGNEDGGPAITPAWARKKRPKGGVGLLVLLALAILAGSAGAFWFFTRAADEAYSFMATGPANVRDAPTASEGRIVGQLVSGDFITGRVQGAGDEQWVEITEGPLRGSFVWGRNLVAEGPDDVLGNNAEPSQAGSSPVTAVETRGAVRYSRGDAELLDTISQRNGGVTFRSRDGRVSEAFQRKPAGQIWGDFVSPNGECYLRVLAGTINAPYSGGQTEYISAQTQGRCASDWEGQYLKEEVLSQTDFRVIPSNIIGTKEGPYPAELSTLNICRDQVAAERTVRALAAQRFDGNEAWTRIVGRQGCNLERTQPGEFQITKATLTGSLLSIETQDGMSTLLQTDYFSVEARLPDGRVVWGLVSAVGE